MSHKHLACHQHPYIFGMRCSISAPIVSVVIPVALSHCRGDSRHSVPSMAYFPLAFLLNPNSSHNQSSRITSILCIVSARLRHFFSSIAKQKERQPSPRCLDYIALIGWRLDNTPCLFCSVYHIWMVMSIGLGCSSPVRSYVNWQTPNRSNTT